MGLFLGLRYFSQKFVFKLSFEKTVPTQNTPQIGTVTRIGTPFLPLRQCDYFENRVIFFQH